MAQGPKTRSIFEDVGSTEKPVATPVTGGIDRGRGGARGLMRIWLMVLFAMVVVMITVGGLTRLTDSGLSITEWAPITGSVPPLSAEVWQSEFEAYQQTAEYRDVNFDMTMSEFKTIYWWEWGHRQLGRAIGLVWAIGFFGLLIARKMPAGWTGRGLAVGALIGLQGAVGWWMVASGIGTERIDVASYRLATHLGLAFGILGLMAWYILRLGRREAELLQARRSRDARLVTLGSWLIGLTMVQVLLGGLVAGIDAGRAFPTWPDMAGSFLPPDPFMLEPVWRNFFEDAGLVQFMHRISAYILFAFGLWVFLRARKVPGSRLRAAAHGMIALLVVQMILGIVTVLWAAPWHVAILHQFTAILLFAQVVRFRFLAGYPVSDSLRGAA